MSKNLYAKKVEWVDNKDTGRQDLKVIEKIVNLKLMQI